MDSLKIPKGGSSSSTGGGAKPTGSVPITVRFNAGEECIDDIFQSFHNNSNNSGGNAGGGNSAGGGGGGGGSGGPNSGGGDSLSSSPSQHHQLQAQQNADEVNTRNNFLQGNFFNRKRSGSIECVSPTSSGPNLVTALSSSSEVPSVGTWKLIKGKVSQTIEDIKSSKSSGQNLSTTSLPKADPTHHHSQQQPQQESQQQQQLEVDSDQENATAHSSVSEDISPSSERRSSQHKADSDSSLDSELLLEGDVDHSRLRRGLAHLKSKVKAKSAAHHQRHQQRHQHNHHHQQYQPISLATAALSSATISTAFGTAAIKTMPNKENSATRSPSTISVSQSNARESRVSTGEMRRRRPDSRKSDLVIPKLSPDEVLPSISTIGDKKRRMSSIVPGKKEIEIESGVEMMENMIPPTPTPPTIEPLDSVPSTSKSSRKKSPKRAGDSRHVRTTRPTTVRYYKREDDSIDSIRRTMPEKIVASKLSISRALSVLRGLPLIPLTGLITVLMLPIPDFVRGVLSCLMSFALVDSLAPLLTELIEKHLVQHPPERTKFEIPDYSKMPICEIPAVEEHKTVKTYAGWMNEVFSYDPNNSHISLSNSVYLKLTGTVLRISTTTARVPKRGMWNEAPIDIATIVFSDHRTYNLRGCRVELLPLGLAKKRYFNRKYPIQLIIKDCSEQRIDDTTVGNSKLPSTASSKEELLEVHWADVMPPQNSAETGEDRVKPLVNEGDRDIDLASTILNANLQSLQDKVNPNADQKENIIPCGDEVRVLLFSRGDREKEDWYRRFVAASHGDVYDQDLHLPNIKLINDADLQKLAATKSNSLVDLPVKEQGPTVLDSASAATPSVPDSVPALVIESVMGSGKESVWNERGFKDISDDMEVIDPPEETFEGLLMSSCAARNPAGYIRFMAMYQSACKQDNIPVYTKRGTTLDETQTKGRKQRREKRLEEELWKGIDQSLYLGPSGSVVWANVLLGRILYSCLHDKVLHNKIQDFLQKKLSSIKLPSFMEDVVIKQIDFGDTPPLVHRVSQPLLDERGTWVDADVTYEGHLYIIVTTKLNLLRLKRAPHQTRQPMTLGITVPNPMHDNTNVQPTFPNIVTTHSSQNIPTNVPRINILTQPSAILSLTKNNSTEMEDQYGSAIYDSDAESSGGSSSEDSAGLGGGLSDTGSTNEAQPTPGNARRIFKIVDRITASNFFQYATELPYVQRAMENMSASITLRVDLKGMVARGTLNIPPPPSDRLWLSFRGPPRLWISAKPTVGDKSVDWSIVTNIIESKLCEEVNKYLVYPNMVDVTLSCLGHPKYYKEG